MRKSTRFSAQTVVTSFNVAEQVLLEVLDVVPYCDEHEDVWSPKLVTVLLETCSQLDSLWKAELRELNIKLPKQTDIKFYFSKVGKEVAKKWVVFWGEEAGLRVAPFGAWENVNYSQKHYRNLDWWTAYNKVKHDRLAYRNQATLKYAVQALSGLVVAISRCPYCSICVAQHKWISSDAAYYVERSKSLAEIKKSPDLIIVDTKLFSHPVQAGVTEFTFGPWASGSYRFDQWCQENRVRDL